MQGKPPSVRAVDELGSPEFGAPPRDGDLTASGNSGTTIRSAVFLWFLLFLVCLGLGYPTLNRYDPTKLPYAAVDGMIYYNMVVGNPPPLPVYDQVSRVNVKPYFAENYYRLLVPYVARPIYWLARGRVRTWDPALCGLLAANSLFTALAAVLLVDTGYRVLKDYPVALLAGALFLLNFGVANLDLAGFVDSGEACFMMVLVWTLATGRWPLLPLWGALGTLAKETFAPLSAVFVFGWWLMEARRSPRSFTRLAWVFAMGLTSLTAVTVAMSSVSGGLVWPWQFAASMRAETLSGLGYLDAFLRCLTDRAFWYVFVWLLPLGLLRLNRLPRSWVVASAFAFGTALVLGAYNDARGNTARALFNVAGPMLSLSVAVLLTESKKMRAQK